MQRKQNKVDETLIDDMARELVNRYGDRAVAIAKERAEKSTGWEIPF